MSKAPLFLIFAFLSFSCTYVVRGSPVNPEISQWVLLKTFEEKIKSKYDYIHLSFQSFFFSFVVVIGEMATNEGLPSNEKSPTRPRRKRSPEKKRLVLFSSLFMLKALFLRTIVRQLALARQRLKNSQNWRPKRDELHGAAHYDYGRVIKKRNSQSGSGNGKRDEDIILPGNFRIMRRSY